MQHARIASFSAGPACMDTSLAVLRAALAISNSFLVLQSCGTCKDMLVHYKALCKEVRAPGLLLYAAAGPPCSTCTVIGCQ